MMVSDCAKLEEPFQNCVGSCGVQERTNGGPY